MISHTVTALLPDSQCCLLLVYNGMPFYCPNNLDIILEIRQVSLADWWRKVLKAGVQRDVTWPGPTWPDPTQIDLNSR